MPTKQRKPINSSSRFQTHLTFEELTRLLALFVRLGVRGLKVTGVTVGAPLFDVLALLGKETSLRRLKRFLGAISPEVRA